MWFFKSSFLSCLFFTVIFVSCFWDLHNCAKYNRKFTREELANIPKRLVRQVTSVEECGGNLTVSGFGGKLSSPNYPNSYGSDLDCQWRLTAAREGGIVLRIKELHIEAWANCSYDYLDIYSGSTTDGLLLHRLCGKIDNYTIVLNSTEVLLVLTTDSTFEEKGFEIEFRLATNPKNQCDQRLTAAEGTISSPGYPQSYPVKSDCLTLITVPENEVVYLTFDVLKLEADDKCTYDYCAIYDGPTEESPLLGRFCTSESSITLKSTNNTVLVHFHSDDILSEQGFVLKYSTEGFVGKSGNIGDCAWNQTENDGIITSPKYPEHYHSNSRCKINIMAPENYLVNFTFTDLNLEPDSNCSFDNVVIQEGDVSPDEKTLRVLCGTLHTALTFSSTTNNVLFTFMSDGFSEFSGFNVKYTFVEDPSKVKPKTVAIVNVEDLFVHISPNATVVEDKRHAITCIPRSPLAKIRWFKDDEYLNMTSLQNGLKLVSQTTLEISKMTNNHVGKYTCTIVSTEESSVNSTIWIGMSFKNDECDIIFRDVPYDVTLTEQIDFKVLECFSPTPNVTISWEKDGVPLVSSEKFSFLPKGHLGLYKLEPSDAGFYTCIAKDNIRNCEKREAAIVTVKPLQKIENVCGAPKRGHPGGRDHKNKPNSGRIVGGSDAEKGAFPWQVMLWDPKQKTFCGGVLLNERWFVSAAHCFQTKLATEISWKQVRIRLGKLDQSDIEPEEFSTIMGDLIIHPNFNLKTFDNDVALVKLKDAVTFTDYIMPICLGTPKFIENNFFSKENQLGFVTGWGKLAESGGVPRILKEIQLPMVKRSICESSTRNQVTRNMFCAGYAQEVVGDSCKGDSGGPFVTEHESRWYLLGIVSWGEGCAQKGKYGFYTKVNNYYKWIKEIIST